MNQEKKSTLPFMLAIIIIGLGFGLWIVFDRHEKNITNIIKSDSIRYERLNKKLHIFDSTFASLRKKDSIQISNFIKLNTRFEKTKKSFDDMRDSIGILPDL